MSDTMIEVRCPRCGHTWNVDVNTLHEETLYKMFYRNTEKPNIKTYRLPCPKCGTYVIVDIQEAPDA